MSDRRNTFAQAAFGDYDEAFEQHLADKIFRTAMECCRCSDVDTIALRPSEMTVALLHALAMTLALAHGAMSHGRLRAEIDRLAEQLHRLTCETLDDPEFKDANRFIFRGNSGPMHDA